MAITKEDLKTGDIGYGLRDVLERHYGVGAITDESIDELIEYLEGESEENHSRNGKACYMIFGDKEAAQGLNDLMCVKYELKSKLNKAERGVLTQQEALRAKREALLLSVDFKEKGITNQQGRNAYVEKQKVIKDFKEGIEKLKKTVDSLRWNYDLVCDEFSNYKLLIRLEISRRQAGQELTLKE